ncbi:MAG: prolipoprotein diacylglyceryl transferase [Candidatus Omnitrophica bacterium]|nr:prolipoprotein diacylglyceryl transferase [Candidatus Omnitrophota bacterium]
MYPLLFSIGNIKVFSYGAMVALGVLIAAMLIYRHALLRQLDAEKIVDMIFWIVFWGLIGGRILYVLINPDIYAKDPLEIIKINKGGLVFHGSLIGAIIAALVFMKRSKQPLFETLDIIFVYVPLAHAIGRLGCFLNGCCFGKPTRAFSGVFFPGHYIRVHPTQLYSAFLLLIIFLVLYLCEKRKRFSGQIVCLYLISYGVMRFSIEFLRDNPAVLGFLTMFQCISIALVLIGLIMYGILKNNRMSDKLETKT